MNYPSRVFQGRDDMRILLRSAEAGDAAALLRLKAELNKDSYYNDLNPDDIPLDAAQQEAEIRDFADCPNKLMLLAFEQGELIGAALISPVSPNPRTKHRALYQGGVLKHYWGYGVGTVLTQELFKHAGEMAYTQYEVEVFADHFRAIEMYQSLGFEEWGRIRRAFRIQNDDIDKLYMGRIL